MKTKFACLILLTTISGCSKSSSIESKDYSGIFHFNDPNNLPLSLRVHISFSGVNFSGSGDSSVLPYVGSGVYKLQNDSIYFTQTGSVPDIFGKGSILEGGFLVEKNADSLTFKRNSPEGITGPEISYRLKKNNL